MTVSDTAAVANRATAATDIIRQAGALALDFFSRYRSLDVEAKANPQDIVSIADRQVEQHIRDALQALFPDDGLVGEEHGVVMGSSGYTWLIDPIDGTAPFLHGLRTWCVVIALLHQGQAVAGLIFDPSGDELFSAIRGEGARLNGQPTSVNTRSTIRSGLASISAVSAVPAAEIAGVIERLHDAGGAYVRLGSAALTLCYISAGRLVAYYEPRLHSWDCVAGLLIVEEAGGKVDPFNTADDLVKTGPVLAASPQAYDDIRQLVGR